MRVVSPQKTIGDYQTLVRVLKIVIEKSANASRQRHAFGIAPMITVMGAFVIGN